MYPAMPFYCVYAPLFMSVMYLQVHIWKNRLLW